MKVLVVENEEKDLKNIEAFLPDGAKVIPFKTWDEYFNSAMEKVGACSNDYDLIISDILYEKIPVEAPLHSDEIYNIFKTSLQNMVKARLCLKCPLIIITKIPRYILEKFFKRVAREDNDVVSLFANNIDELTKQIRRQNGVLAYEPYAKDEIGSVYVIEKAYLTVKSNDRRGDEIISFETWRDSMREVVDRCLPKNSTNGTAECVPD